MPPSSSTASTRGRCRGTVTIARVIALRPPPALLHVDADEHGRLLVRVVDHLVAGDGAGADVVERLHDGAVMQAASLVGSGRLVPVQGQERALAGAEAHGLLLERAP